MGSYGSNYGANYSSALLDGDVPPIPTKRITANLCATTNVQEKLC